MKLKSVKTGAILLAACLMQGCAIKNRTPIEQHSIQLKASAPTGLHMTSSAYLDDGNLVVLGRLERGPLDRTRIPGHIDIRVLAPDGSELSTVMARFRALPSWRRGPNPVAFSAEFPGKPPAGSLIEVTYDGAAHKLADSEESEPKEKTPLFGASKKIQMRVIK